MQRQNGTENTDTSPDVLKLSFKLACDAMEASHTLLKGDFAGRFKWFFNMYTQWYALAYVLRSLRSSSRCGFNADHAWIIVAELLPTGGVHDEHGHGRIWRVLKLLRDQAWSLRQRHMATADSRDQLSSSGRRFPSQHLLDGIVDMTAAVERASIIHDWAGEFLVDPEQSASSSLNLLMPEIPFLPDWNAIINGQ